MRGISSVFLFLFFIHLDVFLYFMYTEKKKKYIWVFVTAKPALWSMLQLNIYCTTFILQKRLNK